METRIWFPVLLFLANALSLVSAVYLLCKTGPYICTRLVWLVLFNLALASGLTSLAEFGSMILLWTNGALSDSHCVAVRSIQYLMLTIEAFFALIITIAFVLYARRLLTRAYRVLKFICWSMWPLGTLLHASDFVPTGGFNPSRNLCVQNYGALPNKVSAVVVILAIVVAFAALFLWRFASLVDVTNAVRSRNYRRMLAVLLCIVPAFGMPVYCEIFQQRECPIFVQDGAELLVSSFLWFVVVVVKLLRVDRWDQSFMHETTFGVQSVVFVEQCDDSSASFPQPTRTHSPRTSAEELREEAEVDAQLWGRRASQRAAREAAQEAQEIERNHSDEMIASLAT